MEPVKVPQHLELGDVIAWGLGPTDLLCIVAGALFGWWLYLIVPAAPALRVGVATPPALLGLALGVLRSGDLSVREWLAIAVAYALRPRLLVSGAAS